MLLPRERTASTVNMAGFYPAALFCVFCLLPAPPAWSSSTGLGLADYQEAPENSEPEAGKFPGDPGFISDTKSVLSAPFRWGKRDWFTFTLVAGITAGLYAADRDLNEWVQEKRSHTSDEISKYAELFGNRWYVVPALGAFYFYGRMAKNERARRAAVLSVESLVLSGALTGGLKYLTHRHRPNTGDPHDAWDGPGFSSSHRSFPSGHAASAFSVAAVLASEYQETVLVPPAAYGIAALTALSRLNDNKHWASDVFLGSAIGYFTGQAIVRLHRREGDRNVTLVPVIGPTGAGVFLAVGF